MAKKSASGKTGPAVGQSHLVRSIPLGELKAFNDDQTSEDFMKGVFEEELIIPLPEDSVIEEDPIVRAMYADELKNPGMRIVTVRHLIALKAAETRMTNPINILKQYDHSKS